MKSVIVEMHDDYLKQIKDLHEVRTELTNLNCMIIHIFTPFINFE